MSPTRIQQANALLGLSRNFTRIGGVAAAGLLIAAVGPGWALALDGVTYAVGAFFVASIRTHRPAPVERSRFLSDLSEGWREFRSRSWLLRDDRQFALINAYAIGAFLVLGPFVAERSLGRASAWGLILAAEAVGMILAGVVALHYRPERPLLIATLAVLTMAPLLALLGMAAPLPLIIAAALVAGVGLELYGVFWETTLQEHIPEEKLSRVSSYDVLGSFALIPVEVAFMGLIAHWIGVENTLIGAAVVVVLATMTVIAVADVGTCDGSSSPCRCLPNRAQKLLDFWRRRRPRVRPRRRPSRGRLGNLGQLVLGDAEVAQTPEAAQTCKLHHAANRVVRAHRLAEACDLGGRYRLVEAECRRKRHGVQRAVRKVATADGLGHGVAEPHAGLRKCHSRAHRPLQEPRPRVPASRSSTTSGRA